MNNHAVEIDGLGKRYRLGGAYQPSLRETVGAWWQRWRQGAGPPGDFWALQDVNLAVEAGEVVGIIGRNGAGKSTLLKILSRITTPTRGRVVLHGRVASLLEVGTGFHPELSGRENIFLNGVILGMTYAEIRRKFDEIVDFAGVADFIDTPIKHYSSGMYVRLAFAVAAHLEAEILLIDEVLSVGDAEFQKKSLGKMDTLARSGRTVLVVSHNLGTIKQLCRRAVLLQGGRITSVGEPERVIAAYEQQLLLTGESVRFDGPLADKVQIAAVWINGLNALQQQITVSPLLPLTIKIDLTIGPLAPFRVTFSLYKENCRLFSLHDTVATASAPGSISSHYQLPARLLRPGIYEVQIGGLEKDRYGDWFSQRHVCAFTVLEEWDEQIEAINDGLLNIQAHTYRQEHW